MGKFGYKKIEDEKFLKSAILHEKRAFGGRKKLLF